MRTILNRNGTKGIMNRNISISHLLTRVYICILWQSLLFGPLCYLLFLSIRLRPVSMVERVAYNNLPANLTGGCTCYIVELRPMNDATLQSPNIPTRSYGSSH